MTTVTDQMAQAIKNIGDVSDLGRPVAATKKKVLTTRISLWSDNTAENHDELKVYKGYVAPKVCRLFCEKNDIPAYHLSYQYIDEAYNITRREILEQETGC